MSTEPARPGSGLGAGPGLSPGSGLGAGPGLSPGSGLGAGPGLSPGSGLDPGPGLSPGSGLDPRSGLDPEVVYAETVAACASMAGLPYDGEPVDQLQHALQSAALGAASSDGGDAEFVVACLLHDIARAPAVAGLVYDAPDEHHGAAAARWLISRYGARVAHLAEQHVAAKRYLVATDPAYLEALSPVSHQTLIDQGGAMSADEVAAFAADPDHHLAVRLRRIDDRAKVVGLDVPDVAAYRPRLLAVAASTRPRAG